MPPRRSKTWRQIFYQFLFLIAIIIGVYIYNQWSFPAEYRHLYPQKFQSHPVKDLSDEVRDWDIMKADVYNTTQVGMCEDVQVTKKDIAYCMNENNMIVSINTKTGNVQELAQAKKGRTYGLRLSRNEKLLYFVNSELGLCEFNIKTKTIKILVSQYQGKPFIGLDSIQTHPSNPDILYIAQASSLIPLKYFHIDILLNNAFGRLFQFNKKTGKLSLVTDGLYFANGIVFQQYNGQQTVLVAETNRLRITRVYVSGQYRGIKQVAVDKLDVYLDNMKANQKGEIWVAGPSMRSWSLEFADYHPWVRRLTSRFPQEALDKVANFEYFGGMRIKFTNGNKKYKVDYVLWKAFPGFRFSTTLNEMNDKLYISSLQSKGVLVIDDLKKKLKKSKQIKVKKEQEQSL